MSRGVGAPLDRPPLLSDEACVALAPLVAETDRRKNASNTVRGDESSTRTGRRTRSRAPEFDESRYRDEPYRDELGGYYGPGGRANR